MTALLDIDGLTIKSGPKVLVDNVSFSLSHGERLGLIGVSGSGKSLTALAAIGLLPQALTPSGSVHLTGTQVLNAPDRDLVPLRGTVTATIFQEPLTALDPLMPIGRQVAEPLRRRAQRDNKPIRRNDLSHADVDLLTQVALPDPAAMAKRYPHELSGGQRQRVAIAMALACKPALLIADEPTTALDVTAQAEILALLRKLVADNDMALLFISHDLPVVSQIVDKVIVLRQGKIVETGRVTEVFANPQHDYTKGLVAAARAFDKALEGTS